MHIMYFNPSTRVIVQLRGASNSYGYTLSGLWALPRTRVWTAIQSLSRR